MNNVIAQDENYRLDEIDFGLINHYCCVPPRPAVRVALRM